MAKRQRAVLSAGERVELQMTSMIDVVFLLLIFFIAATKFKDPEAALHAFLPKKQQAAKAAASEKKDDDKIEDLQDINIRVEKEGRRPKIYMGQAALTSFDQLERALRRVRAGLEKRDEGRDKVRVIIDGHEDVYYGFVVDAMNVCIRVGYRDINFTSPKEQKP